MIADAVDDHGADAVGQMRETVLDREDDAVVQRVALGRPVEADAQHRACNLDLEQRGSVRGAAVAAFPMGSITSCSE